MVLTIRSGMVQKAAVFAVCAVMGSGTVSAATADWNYITPTGSYIFSPLNTRVTIGSGNVNDSTCPLRVDGISTDSGAATYQLFIKNTATAFSSSPKSGILFSGKMTATPTYTSFGGITAGKENTTSGNYASFLYFTTRQTSGSLTERMRITSTGFVGIGDANPDMELSVKGDGGSTGLFSVRGTNNAHEISMSFEPTGSLSGSNMLWAVGRAVNANRFAIRSFDGTIDATRLSIDNNGFVGIGTTTAGSKLQIYGSAAIGYSASTSAPANGLAVSSMVCIGTVNAPGANGKLLINGGAAIGYSAAGTNPPANGLVVSGQVGIGTTAVGTFKLAVEGKIGAREVVVTQATPWPDFVFKNDYKLKPLEQVEKQIKEHKHLENIPTEVEVRKNGVSVGEMQAKLLQKVEELTLYMIELQKDNQQLKRQMNELKRQIDK